MAARHDRTIREAFERYQQLRVNTAGEILPYDPETPTASAEWVKPNLSRVRDSLPCPDFQTTPEFLDSRRRQAATNRRLIGRADSSGQFRSAANLRQVQASLERIIPALEAIAEQEADEGEP